MRIKGTVLLCTVALAISFIVLTVPVSADDDELCVPLGSWDLDPPDGVDQKRSSVEFPHSTHFGYKCQQCHHTWSGEAEVLSCSTSGCHDQLATPVDEETGKADPEKEIQYYKKAYHELCLGCHKEIKERNKELELSKKVLEEDLAKTGPTGCVDCHPKE